MSINNSLIIDIDMDMSEKMADYLSIFINIQKSNRNTGQYLRIATEYLYENENNFNRKYRIEEFSAFGNT